MTHALLVDFQIRPEQAEAFAEAIKHNAACSLEQESGCRRFDVCRDSSDAGAFFLYELYDDAAAIEAHLASAHFQIFNGLTRDWILRKTVRTAVLLPA
jgi:quinol monooxygenase YgiN